MMYTSAVFVAIGLVAITSAFVPQDPNLICSRIVHPVALLCCQKPELKEKNFKGVVDCFNTTEIKPGKCDVDICIAKKNGFGTDDGKFDKQAVMEFMRKEFADRSDVLEEINKECIEGDLSKFGHPATCELTKLRHCINRQLLKNCEEWKDEGVCVLVKDLVKKCID